MDPIAAPRQYEEFEPKTEVVSDERAETIRLHLPEFKREQLRVQLTTSRILRISGERHLGGDKWTRFMKEVSVPRYCDAKDITAKLENGVLSVRQGKLIITAEPQETAKPAVEAPKPQPAQTLQPKPTPEPAQGRPSYVSQMLQEKENLEKKEGEAAHKNWVEAKESFDAHAKPARGEAEADAGKKHGEERRDEEETGGKPEVAERWMSGRVFKEMKKPGNLKMMAMVVVVAMAVALQVAYINKVCGR